ncbi:hypothetical protein PR202_ga31448 [Eleusine coracana subsp. coracana]|uniref:F-box domain-containing protein n=1 Tax=Eleusine coracana subsp. coracana TaxID=191504 RepID=A0AAV5DRG9_ELECO|nr:hypothetical protein PR202_ga31448 [Eleusine coracana subsp. coracana]
MASAASTGAGDCPWEALPLHLQERILALLPLTELITVAAASRALRRLIRSPAFHALLFPPPPGRLLPPLPAPRRASRSSPTTYTLVAVTTGAAVRSYTINTADPDPLWESRGDLPLPFALLGNAAVSGDRGRLFVLGRGSDALLVFDLVTGMWELLPVVMPLGLTTAHLFVFDGRLFLVGGVERFGEVEGVVVWQMDDAEENLLWKEVGMMPAVVFGKLVAGRRGSFWHFQAVDRMGIVCLYNAVDGRLVMFDAANGQWTVLSRVSGLDAEESSRWFGHVLEPGIELLIGTALPLMLRLFS